MDRARRLPRRRVRLTFAVVSLRTNDATRVLALTRSVTTGHVLRTSDLTEVGISAGPGLASVSVTSEASVVGRPGRGSARRVPCSRRAQLVRRDR